MSYAVLVTTALMLRRWLLGSSVIINFCLSGCISSTSRPNVILIVVDDLGYNDLGFMGSNYYETPHIDRLSERSVVFSQAYAASRVCSPSRASLLTGCYTPMHGITDWIGAPSGEDWRKYNRYTPLLPPDYTLQLSSDLTTLPEIFRAEGYKTFFAGKWHLGGEGSLPTDHGFDINIAGDHKGHPPSYFSPYNIAYLPDGPKGENLEMRLAKETSQFLQENKDQPFFAFLSFYAVHSPIQTTRQKWQHFRDKAASQGITEKGFEMERILPARLRQDNPVYAGLVSSMDDAVGEVLHTLAQLNLERNTIIIFTSDNGGVVSGDNYSTNLAPLRGGKGYQWEGGIRVPFIIHLPGIESKSIETPISNIDVLPTLLEILAFETRPTQTIDGASLAPLIKENTAIDRSLFWHYPHYGNQGGEPSSIIRSGNFKLIHYWEDERNELYDLSTDLSERMDLSEEMPQTADTLWIELQNWLKVTKAQFPYIDVEYSREKEDLYLQKIMHETWPRQEDIRKKMQDVQYSPNETWWGSEVKD